MKKILTLMLVCFILNANAQVSTTASLSTLIGNYNSFIANYKKDSTARGIRERALQKTVDSLVVVAKGLPAVKNRTDSTAKVLNDMPAFDLKNVTVVGKVATIVVPIDQPSKTRIDSCSKAAQGLEFVFSGLTENVNQLNDDLQDLLSVVETNNGEAVLTKEQLENLISVLKQVGINLSTIK